MELFIYQELLVVYYQKISGVKNHRKQNQQYFEDIKTKGIEWLIPYYSQAMEILTNLWEKEYSSDKSFSRSFYKAGKGGNLTGRRHGNSTIIRHEE